MSRTITAPDTVLAAGKLPADLLATLLSRYVGPQDATVLVPPGPGHDAAVVRAGEDIIVKSDPITFATSSPATYLVAVNANDIACLGGIPRWITVTALFPENSTSSDVDSLFNEFATACAAVDIIIIGGHTEVTPGIDRILLSATLIGVGGPNGILPPGGARADDDIYLTRSAGIEGTSILATELSTHELEGVSRATINAAEAMLHNPGISIVADAQLAHSINGVHAMHDPTEGGVATAIHELADASSLGVDVDLGLVPVADATRDICETLDISPYGLLSSGALLFTAEPAAREALDMMFSDAGIQVTRIGHMCLDQRHRTAMTHGTPIALPRYDADEITRALARISENAEGETPCRPLTS
ncbi:AIR synthase family protein [soil metagenome]